MTQPPAPNREVDDLRRISDPIARARQAHGRIEAYQDLIEDIAQVRRDALEELVGMGMTKTDIGKAVDMSRARVGQILAGGPRPERAFLGGGLVITIAIGGKSESGRTDGHNLPMVSGEAMAAYNQLAALARSVGLKAEDAELVSPPGHVNLNRAGLIVLCSPRLLPFVGQVLESDARLGFAHDDDGWYLLDRESGSQYRSPMDRGESADYAYVGRLPRPDGRGNFLYLAGIHSMGTKGAAHYVEANLDRLWAETKGRRFSVLIEAAFDPKTRTITDTREITDVYRHEGAN